MTADAERGESDQGNSSIEASGHILVADDDPGVRYVVQWALEGDGLTVRTAASGPDAIKEIAAKLPALVVLDLTMPFATGREVASRLRSVDSSIPILLVTGDGRAREKAADVGAFAYLNKPFEVQDLLAAVRRGLHPA